MTDEEIDQVIAATSRTPLVARWAAPFKRFATWFATTRMGHWATQKTARWQTIIAILVVAAGYPLVIGSIGATDARLRHEASVRVDGQIYVTRLIAYTNAANQYATCIATATAFKADRDRWETLADTFEREFPGSAGTERIVQILRDTLGPPDELVAGDCVQPGPPPDPPSNPTPNP